MDGFPRIIVFAPVFALMVFWLISLVPELKLSSRRFGLSIAVIVAAFLAFLALVQADVPTDLDASGRCGSVEMVVSLETAPARGERRGSIGMVKPSGWHTVRDDSLDGGYLYNRCHLIAWCVSGMNAEKRNLITGTRYMNVEGMLPYEAKVSDFIFAGGGRVYYRVTPDFRSGELVARGVRIQAYSLADRGKGIDFDVYCYNVQPGYRIDYATGKAAKIR